MGEEREKLDQALEAMINCQRWEFRDTRREEFMNALDAYIDRRCYELVSGALKA